MKTMLMYCRPRCQNPKMIGLATANNSSLTIYNMRRLAQKEKGRFFIVDGVDAETARKKIKYIVRSFKEAKTPIQDNKEFNLKTFDCGHTLTIGDQAYKAILGAQVSIAHWDYNISEKGKVSLSESKALGGKY